MTQLIACCSAVLGSVIWRWLLPWPDGESVISLMQANSPLTAELVRYGYAVAWIATPYCLVLLGATVGGLLIERRNSSIKPGDLAPWPQTDGPSIVVGETHFRTRPGQSPSPGWLTVPRHGLYTGTAVFGAIGSGKTSCCMYPFVRQIMGWHAGNAELRPAGLVLEVKGDFCHQVRRILKELGRSKDYVELGLGGRWCYNPLESDLDPYSLAYQISSLLNQLFGKGKEPFWQQAYTNLVKFVILLHRVADDYVTLQDVYRTALDDERLQSVIGRARERHRFQPEARVRADRWASIQEALPQRHWEYDESTGEMTCAADPELLEVLNERKVTFGLHDPEPVSEAQRHLRSIITWYQYDWSQLDARLRSSIVEGISVFLSLFDEPGMADVFCPPKSAYREEQPHRGRWALQPLPHVLESGKVLALNLPVGVNPALGRAVGVMLKQDFQRAVLARIPAMERDKSSAWRDIAFICDEYHSFATAGESDPGGDEKFFSLSRQARLVAIVATQSISSLRSSLPGESWRTLLQTFRTRVFLTLSDEDSCRIASEACGQTERLKEQFSISESSQAGVGLLSGRAGGGKGTYGITKSYAPRREPLFPPTAFAELHNAQAIVAAYDGRNPLPPTYCYLKPWYLPADLGYFPAVDEGRL